MKTKIGILGLVIMMTACSSMPKPEELKASPKCTVWQKDNLGIVTAHEVEGEKARQKSSCWVMGMFLCRYINYTFRPGTTEILSDIGDSNKTIGKFDAKNNTISMDHSVITVAPALIKDGRVDYVLEGPIGPKMNKTVEYSSSCSIRQAALGAASFM